MAAPTNTYISEFKDFSGQTVKIKWYVELKVSGLDEYEFTAAKPSLRYRWYGEDKYTAVRGSEITFNIWIKDATDASHLAKVLDNPHNVFVTVDGSTVWYGYLEEPYYVEAYTTYPYMVTLTANDGLGKYREQDTLMVDFPEPYPSTYSIEDVLNKTLAKPHLTYVDAFHNAPTAINFAHKLYSSAQNDLLEEVSIDPRVFMNDDDQYPVIRDILEAMLTAIRAKLFQANGEWWIVDVDYQTTDTNITYKPYDITSGTMVAGSQDTIETLVDLFGSRPRTNHMIHNNAQREFNKRVKNLIVNKTFKQNPSCLPVMANLSGNFYYGEGSTLLEFDSADGLRNWTNNGLHITEIAEDPNSGWARMKPNQDIDTKWVEKTVTWSYYGYPHKAYSPSGFALYAMMYAASREVEFNFNFSIRYSFQNADGGTEQRWLENTDSGLRWSSTFHTFQVGRQKNSFATLDETVGIPWELERYYYGGWCTPTSPDTHSLQVAIYAPTGEATGIYQIKNFRVKMLNWYWETFGDIQKETYQINQSGDDKEIDVSVGINVPYNKYDLWFYHISSFYTGGSTLKEFTDGSETGEMLGYWIKNMYMKDNIRLTRNLTTDIKSFSLTPLSIIQDYENVNYAFVEGEYDAEQGIWVGSKWVELIPQPGETLGDYSLTDYNDDYYK